MTVHIVSFSCAKCGEMLRGGNECADQDDPYSEGGFSFGCMERQLANLHSLLRSVTGKLEEARLRCEELDWNDISVSQVAALIDGVLEVLA